MKPYTYIPDDYYDLGKAGEHQIEFTCWIDHKASLYDREMTINIANATVFVVCGNQKQPLNVTNIIHADKEQLWKYQAEIRADYEKRLLDDDRDVS